MLLIKNGRVVDPVSGVDEVKDVLVNEGNIVMSLNIRWKVTFVQKFS